MMPLIDAYTYLSSFDIIILSILPYYYLSEFGQRPITIEYHKKLEMPLQSANIHIFSTV